jgi:lysozyme
MLSAHGIAFLEYWEGFRSTMYRDTAGHPTIGIGHLIGEDEPHLLTATLSRLQAVELLRSDLPRFERAVSDTITVPLTTAQRDALIVLAFNIGAGAFAGSTVARRINEADTPERIAEAWKWWNKNTDPNTGEKRPNKGLTRRREAEANLFINGSYYSAGRILAEGAQGLVVVSFICLGTWALIHSIK